MGVLETSIRINYMHRGIQIKSQYITYGIDRQDFGTVRALAERLSRGPHTVRGVCFPVVASPTATVRPRCAALRLCVIC